MNGQASIRNFAIIAHIDHGKSTLADRLLELTGTVPKREMREQMLDSNPIERERGITIKLAPVRMIYNHSNLQPTTHNPQLSSSEYILNLIDTPGHVDFSYEVSRSLAACEGAVLLVDATQGVQAQTLANFTKAREQKLAIIPVINKIDLPNAKIEETRDALGALGFRKEEILKISAKTGENVERVLEAIVERISPPNGSASSPLRALVFSSQYDSHKGVVVFVRVVDGSINHRITNKGEYTNKNLLNNSYIRTNSLFVDKLRFMASGAEVTPLEIGYFGPKMMPCDTLHSGEVGYIATGLKDARLAGVGDTVTFGELSNVKFQISNKKQNKASSFNLQLTTSRQSSGQAYNLQPLPGYKEPKPMVFLGLFPQSADDLVPAREAMERLRLTDSALSFRPISSLALGHGFHCGFLGLLHAEIVQERLSREFGLNMLATAPSVEYRVSLKRSNLSASKGSTLPDASAGIGVIQSAAEFPDPSRIEEVEEPVMRVTIYTPARFIGPVMQLAQEKRGEQVDFQYRLADHTPGVNDADTPEVERSIIEMTYLMPLSEMIFDFFDRLKSVTEGYASLDYELYDYQSVEVVKVDILVNKEKVDALSFLITSGAVLRRSREFVERLAQVIPRAQFQIPIQAALGGQIIARADVKAFRKDVTQKLYGGDRTRKDKLLEAQKKGKARMKLIGKVEIPPAAFLKVLKRA